MSPQDELGGLKFVVFSGDSILEGVVARLIEHKIRAICEWKQAEILELNIRKDHVHMIVTIPPRLAISEMMGILKGKTAIAVFKQMQVLKKRLFALLYG